MADLFSAFEAEPQPPETIGDGATLLRGFATAKAAELVAALGPIKAAAPFRHMVTPGGHTMSVAMTNCGDAGWVSDRGGYRYATRDPQTGRAWPEIPTVFHDVAARAAAAGGFTGFMANSCLINRYEPKARMSLHQDKDEGDFSAPIVSISLGLPATFLFGGMKRSDRPQRFRLENGDVVVWGGATRMAYHGVAPLPPGDSPLTDGVRINLTFRRAQLAANSKSPQT